MDKFLINVDQPWDYKGPDGTNVIKGSVVKIVDEHCVVFKSDNELKFDDATGYYLVFKNRYVGDTLVNLYGIIGGGLLLTDEWESMDSKQLVQNSKYVIIGGLEKDWSI